MRRLFAALVSLSTACSAAVDDPVETPDMGLDASVDGGTSGLDASSMPDDMKTISDLGGTEDVGTPDMEMPDLPSGPACTTGSRDGVCLHVDDCVGANQSVPGFCPGPAEIQCCVPVNAGECVENPSYANMPRPNDGLTEVAGDAGCPSGMAAIGTFCVDRYEASLVETIAGEPSWSPYHNPAGYDVRAVSIEGAVPQGYISGDQAAVACANSGKRLCTDDEWLRACQGPNAQTFPYGDTRQPGVCNDARSVHPAIEYFGTSDQSVFSMLDNACINQLDDGLATTGDHPQCVTGEGLFDMMGNLHEWTSNSTGIFRGGFYVDTEINGPGCLYRTTAHPTSHWDYSTGFRCCADRL